MTTHKSKEVWDKPVPKKARHTHLSPAQKKSAKAAAKRAGRPYPNLVDNLRAAKKKSAKKKPAKKKSTTKRSPRKRSPRKRSA